MQEASISQLQAALTSGELTSVALVEMYLARITQYDKSGPRINSVLELNPDAVAIAAALDAERASQGPRGPLHGIPILIKGNIGTSDQMTTTAGSLALAGSVPAEDAFLVRKLRSAGAVILGKANLTEFANFMSYQMPSGYSSLGGQTLNPYNPTTGPRGVPVLTPCGSSAGSGAATAANLTAAAIGTETSGSILCPSNFNSLVGIKTTLGLVSRSGIIPLAHSQDVAGPMTRTVADAAILLTAIAGPDPNDPITLTSIGNRPSDYTAFLNPNGLAGVRLGIARQYFGSNAETNAIVEQAIAAMQAQGAVIVDPATIATVDELSSYNSSVLLYEFKQDLNAYLSTAGAGITRGSLAEIIRFNTANRPIALEYGQGVLLNSQLQSGNTIRLPEVVRDRARDLTLSRSGIDDVIAEFDLDALIFPASSGAGIGAKAGYPTVIVPAGYKSSGEPVGVSFLGRAFSEPQLIEYAYAYEQATQVRRPPTSTP